jgi:hypothetical protein
MGMLHRVRILAQKYFICGGLVGYHEEKEYIEVYPNKSLNPMLEVNTPERIREKILTVVNQFGFYDLFILCFFLLAGHVPDV